MLFHSVGKVQAPMKCMLPDERARMTQKRRRLGESMLTEGDAAVACARVSKQDRDACIFDVLALNDIDAAAAY